MARKNQLMIKGSENQMEKFKLEVATELGLPNYHLMDRGNLTSRQNGYVGGNMVRKMIGVVQQIIEENGTQMIQNANIQLDVPQETLKMNQLASQNFDAYIQQIQNGIAQNVLHQ